MNLIGRLIALVIVAGITACFVKLSARLLKRPDISWVQALVVGLLWLAISTAAQATAAYTSGVFAVLILLVAYLGSSTAMLRLSGLKMGTSAISWIEALKISSVALVAWAAIGAAALYGMNQMFASLAVAD